MAKYLKKEDALFVLYDKMHDIYGRTDDLFSIDITNKHTNGNYQEAWFDFQPELDELEIRAYDDDWVCFMDDIDRDTLKSCLEERGFTVIFGENY